MNKINNEYMVKSFDGCSASYDIATVKVGLWESEKDLILKHFSDKNKKVLDVGCGAGRTSLAMEVLGYKDIVAVDFSPKMIEYALVNGKESNVLFELGNCMDLKYSDDSFDYALFSFNGLMQIPGEENRIIALNELNRVLKSGGILIFTSHDRMNGNRNYLQLWDEEYALWENGLEDPRLHQFGDIITYDEIDEVEYYIHIPTYLEVKNVLTKTGFEIVDSFIRSKRYKESKSVLDFSDNCRFWIVKTK